MVGTHQGISYIVRAPRKKDTAFAAELFSIQQIEGARRFHRQLPGYRMTPLQGLSTLAAMYKVGGLWTKDESYRLGLESFKALGGSFALYRLLQKELGILGEDTPFSYLASDEVRKQIGDRTFASATDGNHGRGVAWAAQSLGYKSVIYVHSETSQRRIDAIAANGATVVVVDGNYDDAVRQVAHDAEKNGWTVVSDTSWDTYTEIPTWIMQGYQTLYAEAQVVERGDDDPLFQAVSSDNLEDFCLKFGVVDNAALDLDVGNQIGSGDPSAVLLKGRDSFVVLSSLPEVGGVEGA
jgi:diaminopropionate ammonia-lyase